MWKCGFDVLLWLPQQQSTSLHRAARQGRAPNGSWKTTIGVIGTPDDAIALIQRLYASKQGEFGAFLQQVHNWADFEQTKRSYELYQRYVMPHFSGDNRPRIDSFDWCITPTIATNSRKSAPARRA